MSKTIAHKLYAILSYALLLWASPSNATYSNLFVFGDSQSDTGIYRQLTGGAGAPFWEGRISNGPVAVETLAARLGIPLVAGENNFAVSGAYTGYGNIGTHPALAHTGMSDQFDAFAARLATAGQSADPGALYFLMGGSNDLTRCGWSTCSVADVFAAADTLANLVSKLAGLGAQHFMVGNIYLLSNTASLFNYRLKQDLNALGSTIPDIELFDTQYQLYKMTLPNNPWGFTHTAYVPCYQGGASIPCSNPDEWLYWYTGHLTSKAY